MMFAKRKHMKERDRVAAAQSVAALERAEAVQKLVNSKVPETHRLGDRLARINRENGFSPAIEAVYRRTR